MERPLNDRNAADTNRVPQFESICNLKPGSQNLNLQVVVLDCGKKQFLLLEECLVYQFFKISHLMFLFQ